MNRRVSSLVLLLGLGLAVWQFGAIRDWWLLRNYDPPAEVVALADHAALSEAGRKIFYLARPQADDKLSFQEHCPVREAASSLVLGCYDGWRIYILRVERAELTKVMDVTAAHEMLHAAYERLSGSERQRINSQLEQFYAQLNDPELNQVIADYEQTEPGERLNELHSLLPTQIPALSPELETYYQRYFNNQDQVANAYLDYRGVFKALEHQLAQLQADITDLRAQISALENGIEATKARIEDMGARMDSLRASGNLEEYNALVPTYNGLVRDYNSMVARYKDLIASHNSKVEQANRLALEQNELVDSLDSTKFTPL